MNILLINHHAGSKRHGMAFRAYYLAREWVRAGHNVKILAASFSHIRSIQPDFTGRTLDETIDGIKYRWYATPPYKGNGLGRVKNIYHFLLSLWRDAYDLSLNFKPDVVIASSTYPMDIWPAQKIARISNCKLVFELHDLWPLSPIEISGMSPLHPFIILCQIAENHIYKSSDLVISMLPNVSEHVKNKGLPLSRLTIVPNGVSLDEWNTRDETHLDEKIQHQINIAKSQGNKIIIYTGSHGLPNAIDNLLDAANLLREENVSFILVGDGHEKDRLLKRIKDEGLNNIHMFSPIPKNQIPILLSYADGAYLGAPRHSIYRFGVSPNKMIDYMMAGVPILYAIEAGNDPVTEADCGITIPAENPIRLAAAICSLKSLPMARLQEMGKNGKIYALKNHTYSALAEKFLDSINQLKA